MYDLDVSHKIYKNISSDVDEAKFIFSAVKNHDITLGSVAINALRVGGGATGTTSAPTGATIGDDGNFIIDGGITVGGSKIQTDADLELGTTPSNILCAGADGNKEIFRTTTSNALFSHDVAILPQNTTIMNTLSLLSEVTTFLGENKISLS